MSEPPIPPESLRLGMGPFEDPALFVVSGSGFFRLNTDLSLEAVDGTVLGDGNPEMDGTREVVFIADGTSLQYYSGSGAPAAGTLTLTGNAANNETVTIGMRVYTWKTALTASSAIDEVLIGASADASLDNLISAINDGPGGSNAGVLYGSGTDINSDVVASAGAGTTMDVDAKLSGTPIKKTG